MERVIDAVFFLIGMAGIGWGLAARRELKKWAYQCQNARIAIAYKRKVRLQAPLIEWLTWINMLDKDQASNGRTVYTMGGTTVAIIRAPKKVKTVDPVGRAANVDHRERK